MLRKILQECIRQSGHITRRRSLPLVWQTGSVAEFRSFHPQFLRLAGHLPGKSGLCPGKAFGDDHGCIVCGLGHQAKDQLSQRYGLANPQAELGRWLSRSVARDGEALLKRHFARIKGFEGQIQRHQFRQGSGVTPLVGIAIEKHVAAFRFHDNGRHSGLTRY
jgi:hypothetical protein